tara:strand:- start:1159 stop:1500 length:342 start_codon:yes stop_codon:yes gene_type:complete
MNDETTELWIHQIRKLAEPIKQAEYQILVCDADIKKLQAQLKTTALANGNKTVASQEVFAENNPSLYKARLRHAIAKSELSALKVELKALEVGFEEWRTKMVNQREEKKFYGA